MVSQSVLELERKVFLRELCYAAANAALERGRAQEAAGGPQRLEEARRRDCRQVAWNHIRQAMHDEPTIDQDFLVEDGEQHMTLTGMIHLTLLAIDFPWADRCEADEREAEWEEFYRLTVHYLDQWEMGKKRLLMD